MHEHFDNIERELKAAQGASEGNPDAFLDRIERLLNDVRSARFAARFAAFGKTVKPGRESEPEIEGIVPPPRKFEHDDTVRTKEGYLARVGYYDRAGKVVVNVVYQACEYDEADLTAIDL